MESGRINGIQFRHVLGRLLGIEGDKLRFWLLTLLDLEWETGVEPKSRFQKNR